MSAWEELLAAIGIGNAKLEVKLDSAVCPRGADVTGRVSLIGGEVSQQIEWLVVRLEELVQQGKSSEWKARDKDHLAVSWLVTPHARTELPFSLRLPDDAVLTNSHYVLNWRVSVEADILWAVNPRAGANIEVVPHHEVTAIQRAVERLGFTRTGVYVDFALKESPDTVVVYYKAPPGLRDQLDGASLHLRALGAHVHGRLILNRHQHGVGEALKALVGGDREEHPLQFPRHALLNSKGGPNSRAADATLNAILSRALILPENANAKMLLRPTSGPPSESDSLLRPAASAGQTRANKLLRPLDDEELNEPSETLGRKQQP